MAQVGFDPGRAGGDKPRIRPMVFILPAALLIGAGIFWLKSQPGSLHAGVGALKDMAVSENVSSWSLPMTNAAYKPDPPPAPVPDEKEQMIRLLQRQVRSLEQEVKVMRDKPVPAPKQEPVAQTTPPSTETTAKPRKHASMLFVKYDVPASTDPPPDTYVLAAGATKILCQDETIINSEVPSVFTAKVTTSIYDTKTGKHLLIPQNSTILGKYNSGDLLFGNTRMETISLTVNLPNGEDIDLGESPIMDQTGMAGLTGEVYNHWGRLFGAILITSVLRGGTETVRMNTVGTPTGAITNTLGQGIVQGSQTVTRPFIDTRPTIITPAGQPCVVLLTKPLHLKAFRY